MELDPEKFIALFQTTFSWEGTKDILKGLIKPMFDEYKKETMQKIKLQVQDNIAVQAKRMLQLEERMDKYDQPNIRNKALISGIMADKDEVVNIANITNFIEKVMKLEVKKENITSAHKMDKSDNIMLVSFDSSNTKDRIFEVKKKTRWSTSATT